MMCFVMQVYKLVFSCLYIDLCYLFKTAQDFGGPRKEFFRLALLEIKEKYFDEGLRDLLFADYEMVGKVFGKV